MWNLIAVVKASLVDVWVLEPLHGSARRCCQHYTLLPFPCEPGQISPLEAQEKTEYFVLDCVNTQYRLACIKQLCENEGRVLDRRWAIFTPILRCFLSWPPQLHRSQHVLRYLIVRTGLVVNTCGFWAWQKLVFPNLLHVFFRLCLPGGEIYAVESL